VGLKEMEHQEKKAEQLLSENQRLKHLIARFSDKEMSNGHIPSGNGQASVYLPLAVSKVLSSGDLFGERVRHALQLINRFADTEHMLLFHFNKTTKSQIIIDGNGEQINPSDLSQQIEVDSIYQFLQSLNNEIFMADGTPEQFPEPLQPFVIHANSAISFILFPLTSIDGATGFLALQESQFPREWLSFEKEILALVTNQLSDAFQRNRDQIELGKKEALNSFLLKIAETFSQNDRFEVQVRSTLKITARFFGFSRAILFENVNNDIFRIADEWHIASLTPVKEHLQDIANSHNLADIKKLLIKKKIITSKDNEVPGSTFNILEAGKPTTKIIIAIQTVSQFHGFILFEDSTDRAWGEDEKNTFIVVTDFFAAAFERQHAMDHMVASHEEAIRLTKSLSEKEQFLESILSSVPVGILLIRNREILFSNKFIQDIVEMPESELIGRHISQFYFNKSESDTVSESFYQQIQQNGIITMETKMRSAKGDLIHSHVIGKHCPINGFKDSYLLIVQDITLLKQAQTDLHESEERSRKILEASIEGVLIFDSPEKLNYINQAAAEMLGYNNVDVNEIHPSDIFGSGKELTQFHQGLSLVSQDKDYKSDTRIWNCSGEEILVEMFGTSIIIKGKKLYYFSLRNITDRKNHELALQTSEKKFRSLTENTTDQIIRISRNGELLFANPAFLDFYEINDILVIGNKLVDVPQFPSAFANSINRGCCKLIEKIGLNSYQMEATAMKKQGMASVEWRISPETNTAGEIVSFLCSGRDITQRKLAEQELRITQEKAVSADRLKSAFLANLSHEVRTPLNAIVGFSSLLKEKDTTDAERDEFVNIITRSSDHLMSLISDIVDIAKIESGELSITKSSFSINTFLKDIYLVFQKRITLEKHHAIEQLRLEIPGNFDDPIIVTDITRLSQIFNSLLDNAIKFTPKGIITFGYVIDNNMFRFYVKDTGIGIDNEQLNIIFQPFRQGDESTSKKYGGTGLGLSICRKLTEALGGTIHVHSIPDEGSEFFFEIPDIHQHKPKPEYITNQLFSTGKMENLSLISYNWPDKIILLIDDNSSVHLQMRKMLEKTGVTLISARTGASARELVKNRNSIDLMLVSLQMNDMNAIDFVAHLRHHLPEVPLIAMAGDNIFTGDEKKFLDAGFNDVILKPLLRDELMTKMNHFLTSKELKTVK
jgi:PAS domain S-box-containing protein